jgi:hypothetical protein
MPGWHSPPWRDPVDHRAEFRPPIGVYAMSRGGDRIYQHRHAKPPNPRSTAAGQVGVRILGAPTALIQIGHFELLRAAAIALVVSWRGLLRPNPTLFRWSARDLLKFQRVWVLSRLGANRVGYLVNEVPEVV